VVTLQVACWSVAAIVLGVAALMTLQAAEHIRYARSRARRVYPKPPSDRVALFVPCKGNDADLEANLRPFFEQDHQAYELIFIVECVDDDAHDTIERLIRQYPARQARLVIAGLAGDSGQKVHNLLVATEALPPGVNVLAFADADIRPPRNWLRLLTQRIRPFAASSGYRWFVPKRTTLANLLISTINSAVVPTMFPGIHHTVWGGSWAIQRELFESSRLREAWRGTLSDDLVASAVLARLKLPIALEPACILPSPIDVDFRTTLTWVRRQYLIGRVYSPWLWTFVFVGHLVNQLVFWGCLTAAAVGGLAAAPWAWQPATVAGALYGLQVCRGWLKQRASRIYLSECQRELAAARWFDIVCGPLAALTLAIALVASAIGRRISWKGNVYEMARGGQIRRIPTVGAAGPAAVDQQAGALRRSA